MIIENVRCDWVFVLEANKNGKFGVCAMLPKGSDQEKQVQAAVDKAKAAGIAAGKFTEANTKSASFKKCLRDGDYEIETEDRPKHYENMMFINASNNSQPGLVGSDNKPILDSSLVYSGCYFHLDVNFYAFSHPKGSKGVGAGINNIMLVKEGERLDGRQSAETAFAGMAVEGGELE